MKPIPMPSILWAPEAHDLQVLEEGLRDSGEVHWQRQPYRPLALFLRDEHEGVLGGVVGNTGGPWLYVAALCVTPPLRGKGIMPRTPSHAHGDASGNSDLTRSSRRQTCFLALGWSTCRCVQHGW